MGQQKPDRRWLWVQIAIALGTGALAAWISYGDFKTFSSLRQPPLSPPAWIFPVAWTILYILMAVGVARVQASDASDGDKRVAYWLYGLQLAFNFLWTILFFTLKVRVVAFGWLVALVILVALMIDRFRRIDTTAAWLQLPYMLWLLFAGYLNLAIVLLNDV